jgi:outer membrane protein
MASPAKPILYIVAAALISLAVCSLYSRFFSVRIAYVENGKIIDGFNEAIAARKLLAAEAADLQKQVNAQQDTLKMIFDKFQSAPAGRKEQLQAEFQRRNALYNQVGQAAQEKSALREGEIMTPVSQKINDFLEIWGHQHNYDFILGTTSSGNLVQANKKLNVTLEVLEDLNKKYK